MDDDSKAILKWTLGSGMVWFAAFAGVSISQALSFGISPLEVWGPIGVLSVIGGTVGALVGPMVRGIYQRFSGR